MYNVPTAECYGDAAPVVYAVLQVQRLHQCGSLPIAVILLDGVADALYFRFRADLQDVVDEEAMEVLSGIPETIACRAADEGATRLFQQLQDQLSNYVTISEPLPLRLVRPIDWSATLDLLFARHVIKTVRD